ncbi:hypothetical protein [Leifsonia poae]|uniref:hypothetical protein n=1 Tax=Leifsonia poae TaxID=110933 RepID=UPI003D66B808
MVPSIGGSLYAPAALALSKLFRLRSLRSPFRWVFQAGDPLHVEVAEMTSTTSRTSRKQERERAWRRLRQAIVDEILDKLPSTVPLDDIPATLSIPPEAVRAGLMSGTLVGVIVGDRLHMKCDESAVFLREQTTLRLPLPESLRPTGAASTLHVREPILCMTTTPHPLQKGA